VRGEEWTILFRRFVCSGRFGWRKIEHAKKEQIRKTRAAYRRETAVRKKDSSENNKRNQTPTGNLGRPGGDLKEKGRLREGDPTDWVSVSPAAST
jgi:hypothetical protein